MSANTSQQVRKRRVFYIPGYDPFHPRRYRELYRAEGAAQAAISGYDLTLTPKQGDHYGWRVAARMDDAEIETEVEVLVWSDIVKKSMSSSIPATYVQLFRTAWIYIASGTLRRLMWLRKGPIIAALYPVGILILQAVVAVLLGLLAMRLAAAGLRLGADSVSMLLRTEVPTGGLFVGLKHLFTWGAGCWAAWQVLRWFKARDNRIYAHYLMHDYAFSAQFGGATPPALVDRLGLFRETVANALAEDVDEVLVVGHSSGAHLAVSMLADLIRAGQNPADGPALGFLSLGQVVPMVSFLPKADQLRADLNFLSQRSDLFWLDVTAPGDGCSFALCDPVEVSGVAPDQPKGPLVISAAFTQTLSPERWNELRWRFFRLHFQYLCAFDRVGDYDYFRITAGPLTLTQRFAGRNPSQSRIDVPASKYTSMRHDTAKTSLSS